MLSHSYLLSYDALAFHAYLETIVASNTTSPSGEARQHQSPWLLTDAANAIFQAAKRRCYTTRVVPRLRTSARDLADDEEGWEALDEIQGTRGQPIPRKKRKPWLPEDMEPVLEELPKWSLLADVLKEIEEEMIRQEGLGNASTCFSFYLRVFYSVFRTDSRGSNTVLIMTSSTRNSTLVNEFLSGMDTDAEKGSQGRKMMEHRLRMYLWWKGQTAERKQESRDKSRDYPHQKDDNNVSEALRKKDKERQERTANRRRVRGGAPGAASTSSRGSAVTETLRGETDMHNEAENIAEL
jgi:DNA excision repair protein ERCC-4